MKLKKFLKKPIEHFKGEEQKKSGFDRGRSMAEKENKQKQIGALLMNELQRLKEDITENPDDCPKCRRTRRKLCKKHKRMMMGLDHLGGQIAKKYLDKDELWKENA